MLNQIVLVGRIVKEIELKESENGKKYTVINLAVPQSFKNVDGVYDTNFIECILWDGIAENTKEYCKKGDLVGIKGRLQRIDTSRPVEIIAERVTFLSSRANKINEEMEGK